MVEYFLYLFTFVSWKVMPVRGLGEIFFLVEEIFSLKMTSSCQAFMVYGTLSLKLKLTRKYISWELIQMFANFLYTFLIKLIIFDSIWSQLCLNFDKYLDGLPICFKCLDDMDYYLAIDINTPIFFSDGLKSEVFRYFHSSCSEQLSFLPSHTFLYSISEPPL